MEKPLVSIITITYNRADLIHRCIESIQKQTYDNYEHIIADGNSSDNTEEIVRRYNDPHIKYIKLSKNGCSFQLRSGADVASGKYITFLDDDDEYLPSKLEKQVALFESLPETYGVVYCWMSYYNNNNPNKVIKIHKTELRGDVKDIVPSLPLVTGTPTMMIRRDIFDKYGVSFNDDIGYLMSDWELMARICQHCLVDYVPESLVKVYVNHGHARLSSDFYSEKAKRAIIFHTHFLNTFSELFAKYPKKSALHLQMLAKNNMLLGNWKEGFKYYIKLIRYRPNLRTFALIPFVIIQKVKYYGLQRNKQN